MHLERLITLLEVIAAAGRPISVAQIHKATDLPKPSCYRLVNSLLEQGLIDEPSGDGRYIIGARTLRIAMLGQSDKDVMRAAAPQLKAAASSINETVFLARFRNRQVEIIHVETPDDPKRSYIHPGLGKRPMHACSCSKVIAAFAEPANQDVILSETMTQFTEFTKVTQSAVRAEFPSIVARGFAECNQEIDMGIASVAAPIAIGKLGATFSVGAVGPIRRFKTEDRMQTGETLIGHAKKLSGAIQLCNVAKV